MLLNAKESARKTFTVPAKAGDYATEVITFGVVGSGQISQSFVGVTAVLEACPPLARLELWLPQVADATLAGSDRGLANYCYAGLVLAPARVALTVSGETVSFGSATWPLAGFPGAMLRAMSGGVSGPMIVSATAD